MKRIVGWLLIVAAVAFLGFAGWSWRSEPAGSDFGQDRDRVLAAGRAQIATLNTMDHGEIDAGLRAWFDSATGPLREQLERDAPQSKRKIQKARTTATGTVVDAAVTALDQRAGNAQLIATVRVQITPQTGAPSIERRRYEAGLTRVGDDWKLKSLTSIPVSSR